MLSVDLMGSSASISRLQLSNMPWLLGLVITTATEEIGAMGREIDSRQGIGFREKNNIFPITSLLYMYKFQKNIIMPFWRGVKVS
jgi:hypothetical protein